MITTFGVRLSGLGAVAALTVCLGVTAAAAQDDAMAAKVEALLPELEAYIGSGMQAYEAPGLAIGIVVDDELVYAKGFGVRRAGGPDPVTPDTVFQIGSTTKAFLGTTMAILVDRGAMRWDDRVVDLFPSFQLYDPWVTREFRVFDLLAQRSGLQPYVNDTMTALGYDADALFRSLRSAKPVSSFRSAFAYVNIPHLLAGRIVAGLEGLPGWSDVAQREILDPLGMTETSFTAEAIEAAPNHAVGHGWTPAGVAEIPFDPSFPYVLGPAGDINSTITDMARWVRLQLGLGSFEGQRIVSAENIAYLRIPKIAMSETASYAMGWVDVMTPNGRVVWHNGGTNGFGAYVGLSPERGVGVVILTNEMNVGLPDAVGAWVFDRLLGNPDVDVVAASLARAREAYGTAEDRFARPADPLPPLDATSLAGNYAGAPLGPATVTIEAGAPVLTLQETGARLALDPWSGSVFTVRLIGEGKFVPIAKASGDLPLGFAQFQSGPAGALTILNWSVDEGTNYILTRR
jgi:CubicO group peptidase (beta-lactamase class C family)